MIKSISQSGKYISVQGGTSYNPYITPMNYNGQPPGAQGFIGQVRYNATSQTMEVFDGNSWMQIAPTSASVGLTPDAERILDWAAKRMQEDADLERRMQEHPSLRDAWEKFNVINNLTLEAKHSDSETA